MEQNFPSIAIEPESERVVMEGSAERSDLQPSMAEPNFNQKSTHMPPPGKDKQPINSKAVSYELIPSAHLSTHQAINPFANYSISKV